MHKYGTRSMEENTMKLKKILVGVSACAIAVSAMALSVSAAITNADDSKKEAKKVDCNALDVASIVGIKAEITVDGDMKSSNGLGGGMVFDFEAENGWVQFEWGLDREGKSTSKTDKLIKIENTGDKKYTITYMGTTPYFSEGNKWNNATITSWWGADFTVDSLIPLDKDGNEVKAGGAKTTEKVETVGAEKTTSAAADDKKEDSTDTTAAETKEATTTTSAARLKNDTATTTAKKADGTKAGDAGVGLAVAGLAGGAAAMFIARKKH